MKTQKVVITGGSGLIGRALVPMLRERNFDPIILSRSSEPIPGATVVQWDPYSEDIAIEVLRDCHAIIHLAGANIGEKRWTSARKKEIIESRVIPLQKLASKAKESGYWPKIVISASGTHTTEGAGGHKPFLPEVIHQWEAASDIFKENGIRTVILRTGVVLSPKGGALQQMALPVKFGLSAPLGNGKQWLPWIHLVDICRLYCEALEDQTFSGTYDAVAPDEATNEKFMRLLSQTLNRPFWPIKVPALLLKMALGEMASVVLEGEKSTNQRIKAETRFNFNFPTLESALSDLLRKD